MLRAMAAEGRSVIFISHKLDEVMAVSDRVTVLRDGRNVGTVDVADTSTRELARLMVGRDVVLHVRRRRRARGRRSTRDRVVLAVERPERRRRPRPDARSHDVDLRPARRRDRRRVRRGRQRAARAGRGDLRDAAARRPAGRGRRRADSAGADPRELIAAGVAHVPEDRLHTGTGAVAARSRTTSCSSRTAGRPMSSGPFVRAGRDPGPRRRR